MREYLSQADAILRQRDAGVLRKAAERLESADFIKNRPNINYAEANEIRLMADDLSKS